MKYRKLTKEQFNTLHKEFSQFLASQKIDAITWSNIKKETPQEIDKQLNTFSDIVWHDVLSKVKYIEHFSKNTINLFKCDTMQMYRIVIHVTKEINILEKQGYDWVLKNPKNKAIEYLKGTKKYEKERNIEIFDLIEKGGVIANKELFEYFNNFI